MDAFLLALTQNKRVQKYVDFVASVRSILIVLVIGNRNAMSLYEAIEAFKIMCIFGGPFVMCDGHL